MGHARYIEPIAAKQIIHQLLPREAQNQPCSEFGIHPRLPFLKELYDDDQALAGEKLTAMATNRDHPRLIVDAFRSFWMLLGPPRSPKFVRHINVPGSHRGNQFAQSSPVGLRERCGILGGAPDPGHDWRLALLL